MSEPLVVEREVHFHRRGRGARKAIRPGPAPADPPRPGRVPRVARLLALAHRFEALIREGAVMNCAELARLGHVTRARVSQIMSLLHLAPDVQEAVLHLAPVRRGRDPIVLRDLLPIAVVVDWRKQRVLWRSLA